MSQALPLTNTERARLFHLDLWNNMETGITANEAAELVELSKRLPIRRWPPIIPPPGTPPPTITIGEPTPVQQIVSVGGSAPVV
jgi:hypothetical protein